MNTTLQGSMETFNHIPMGILIIDSTYHVVFWNQCLVDWTHIPKKEIVGKDLLDYFPKLRKRRIKVRLDSIFQGGIPIILSAHLHHYIIPSLLPNGEYRIQHSTITSIQSEKKGEYNALFSIQDVTDLFYLKEKADYANKMKSRFLANVSHELRTPLNAIIGFSKIMSKSEEQDIAEMSSFIYTSGERLLGLINNILDLAKIESGKQELHKTIFQTQSLSSLIDNIIMMKGDKEIDIYINYDPELPETIYSDYEMITQVLLNLLSNAMKFTEKGLVSLDIGYLKSEQKVQFKVIDTGQGISKENLPKIFEEFYQIDGERQKMKGTGLGLPICKQLVKLLGGKISASSERGVGTTLQFSIDISEPSVEQDNRGKQTLQTQRGSQTFSVLIAEDEEINQKLLQKILEGYEIHIVSNGQEVLDFCETNIPDLILMDIRMPVMDGNTAFGHLRTNRLLNEIPVVAITASAMKGDRERFLEMGYNEYISKPIDHKELHKLIMKFIEKK